MSERCVCGERLHHSYESWHCVRCRRACCPACAERDGARVTCVRCATRAVAGPLMLR